MAPVNESRLVSSGSEAGLDPEKEPSLGEVAEKVAGRLTTAAVLASAIIALAIYARPAPPRYEAVVGDGKIVRIDTRSGTVISCEAGSCFSVLRKGQQLARNPNRRPALKAAEPDALPPPAQSDQPPQ